MKTNSKITIRDMIAQDFKTASLFLGCRIDLPTEREKTIEVACMDHNINLLHLKIELNDVLAETNILSSDYNRWPLRLLFNFITIRHRYFKENILVIQQFLNRLTEIDKGHDLRIINLVGVFNKCAETLVVSLNKIGGILSCGVEKLLEREEVKDFFALPSLETVCPDLKEMTDELSFNKGNYLAVSVLIDKYVPTSKALTCYKITKELLAEFKNDLYKTIDLQYILLERLMLLENGLAVNPY